jgi:CelD/BcsL family acetyltransferase involved in cellulose biosynthesis
MVDNPAQISAQILTGAAALKWMRRAENLAEWERLYRECAWATAFQSSGFSRVWFEHYGGEWSPVIVLGLDDGRLIALMPLATNDDRITGVGAHQAEYHGWLGEEASAAQFLRAAVQALRSELPGRQLLLKYLHAKVPRHALHELCASDMRARLSSHVRGLLALEGGGVSDALKKKGNRSKLNRLRRQGQLDFRMLSADALERQMDLLTAYCDFRQGAVNGDCPFTDDPHKREFHLAWARELSDQVHVSGLFLNDRLISALFLAKSANEAHIAILAHAPEHAENSPNKLQIYEAALALAGSGVRWLDMTPGGDEWKMRFATTRDEVHELIVHADVWRAQAHRLRDLVTQSIHNCLSLMGLSPATIRRAAGVLIDAKPKRNAIDGRWIGYRVPPTAQDPSGASVNALQTLLTFGPSLTNQSRQSFLFESLRRIEAGWRCYSTAQGGALVGIAWTEPRLAEIDGRLSLSELRFSAHADRLETGRRLLAAILRDTEERDAPVRLLSIKVGDEITRTIVESLGFERQSGAPR